LPYKKPLKTSQNLIEITNVVHAHAFVPIPIHKLQFLRHLRNFADNTVGDDFLRTIWVSRLPKYLRPHLAVQTADSLDQQAYVAYAIVSIIGNQGIQIIQISQASTSSNFRQGDLD